MTDAKENWPETPSGEPIDVDAIAEGGDEGPYDADGFVEPGHDEHPRLVARTTEPGRPRRVDRGTHLVLGQGQRYDHRGQHDLVVKGQHRQGDGLAHQASKA